MIKTFEQFHEDIYYHCSDKKFDDFENIDNKMYQETDVPTWFFTKDLEYAKRFGKWLYSVKLNLERTFDLSDNKHKKLFMSALEAWDYSEAKIDNIFDEQFVGDLPYWTCSDAFYVASMNGFDSILVAEELEKEVLSVGVFDTSRIEILNIKQV